MRFTVALLRRKIHRYTYEKDAKRHWYRQDKFMNVRGLQLSPSVLENLASRNINVDNVEDMSTSTRYERQMLEETEPGYKEAAEWKPPVDLDSLLPRDLREGRTQPAHLFQWRQRFSQGVAQAAALTNSVVKEGLAPPIQQTYSAVCSGQVKDYTNEHLLEWLQRSILRAHVWHTEETKLPRRFRPNLSIFKHKPEFGISPANAARSLFSDMHRSIVTGPVAQSMPSIYAALVPTRGHCVETFMPFWRKDGPQAIVAFREKHELMLSSEKPLPPVHSLDEVAKISSEMTSPPNVWPFSPLVDLTETKIYRDHSFDGWPFPTDAIDDSVPSFPFVHPRLFFASVDVPNLWSDFQEPEMLPFTKEDRKAIAVLKCYAQTVATAHRLYGESLGEKLFTDPLPKPIVCHAVLSDSVYFDFVTFQLNTLHIPERAPEVKELGLLNIAWVDAARPLFEKKIPVRSLLRNTQYRNVDIDVYKRLLSFYCSVASF